MELNHVQGHTHLVPVSATEAEMDHTTHRARTVSGCVECDDISYEPSWYATLLAAAVERDLLTELQGRANPAFH